jgi:hypothetical protein
VHSCRQEKGAESSLLRPGTGACAHKILKASETLSVCTRYGRADSNLGPLGLSELGVQTQVKAIATAGVTPSTCDTVALLRDFSPMDDGLPYEPSELPALWHVPAMDLGEAVAQVIPTEA